jgi:hypothetical protein
MTWNCELKKPLIFLCSVMPYNEGHGTYCLTSVDITFDSRESLYFAITFPENGRLFEKLEAVKGLFCKGLRGFARKCEISWSHPDADCTKEMVDKSLVEVEKVFESQAV